MQDVGFSYTPIKVEDDKSGLPDNSVDVVLLYDTFHDLSDPDGVLEELHRVLKLNGILSFTDHHMEEYEIVFKVRNRGLSRYSREYIELART